MTNNFKSNTKKLHPPYLIPSKKNRNFVLSSKGHTITGVDSTKCPYSDPLRQITEHLHNTLIKEDKKKSLLQQNQN